jgi:hypothetical protein
MKALCCWICIDTWTGGGRAGWCHLPHACRHPGGSVTVIDQWNDEGDSLRGLLRLWVLVVHEVEGG